MNPIYPDKNLSRVPSIEEIVEAFRSAGVTLFAACELYVRRLDADPSTREELIKAGFAQKFLHRVEKAGRNKCSPTLALAVYPAADRIIDLPRSEQEEVCRTGIEVMDPDETTSRLIPVESLTSAQARQVFSRGHIRDLAEQRTYLRAIKARMISANPIADFKVTRDFVITTKPGKWSRNLILQWLQEMK
jgi:hypothetical protein